MATAKGHEAKNTILVFRVKKDCVCFVLLLLRMLTLEQPLSFWLKARIIGNAVFILQPLEKESSRAPYRNNPQITGPGTSILSSSTIGILDSLAE